MKNDLHPPAVNSRVKITPFISRMMKADFIPVEDTGEIMVFGIRF